LGSPRRRARRNRYKHSHPLHAPVAGGLLDRPGFNGVGLGCDWWRAFLPLGAFALERFRRARRPSRL
jgi:hypothetical protein